MNAPNGVKCRSTTKESADHMFTISIGQGVDEGYESGGFRFH